ncbi:MAG: YciI family protein [Alphaproteobacteria bacterium]
MARLFAVWNTRGAAWNDSRPMEEQEDWKGHAAFMDALQAEGFVVIGGPLVGTRDALLIIRADDAEEIQSRLAEDPWRRKGLLTTTRIIPWTLRLGSLG